MTIVEEYLRYTKQWKSEFGENTIVLLQVGTFFEVYALKNESGNIIGSEIENFANINDLQIAEKSNMNVNGLSVLMAGFNIHQLEKYINKLQNNDYTTVVYKQDIQGKNTTRSLSQIISPGTFFTHEAERTSNVSMCVWLQQVKATKFNPELVMIGIATLDIFTGKTTIQQSSSLYEHNPSSYDDLERCVSINQPRECIIVSKMDEQLVKDVVNFVGLDKCKVHFVNGNNSDDNSNYNSDDNSNYNSHSNSNLMKYSENAEKQTYQKELFKRFYPDLSEETIVCDYIHTYDIAVQSFVMLIDFVCQHSQSLTTRISKPTFENDPTHLILANHSLKQLNMLTDERHTGKLSSVGSFLNNCVTAMGKRKFAYNLHHPSTDIQILKESYDLTDKVLQTGRWEQQRAGLTGVHDMEKLLRKFAMKQVTPKDFATLFNDIKKISIIAQATNSGAEKIFNDHTTTKGNPTECCNTLMSELTQTFNLDRCITIDDMSVDKLSNIKIGINDEKYTFINPGVSQAVDNLLDDFLDSKLKLNAIVETLSEMIGKVETKGKKNKSNASHKYVKIHETPKSEPVLLATKRRITLLKDYIKKANNSRQTINYTSHDGTIKNFELDITSISYGTCGSNKSDEVIMNPLIKDITLKVQKSVDDLVFQLITFFKSYIDTFLDNGYIDNLQTITSYATEIDVLQCKAYIASKFNYCKPTIDENAEKSFCDFTGIRHPLIEHIQTSELYVTNDLTIGNVKGGGIDGLLLYGTNAVGKTSFIKSVGISVIMAQSGLFVPCKKFNFHPYTYIFTRILGNDNLFKGLSTFAVEMSELRTILTLADENSLILGDELCSGTESDSALSIFTAGLETLHSKKCTFLFATHFHEVTRYEEVNSLDRMKFMHMEVAYDNITGKLIYNRKLKDGPGVTMYGLEVCKSLNLPEGFLSRAHTIRMKYREGTEGVLSEKASHFNSAKIRGKCEICNEHPGTEVHHLQHQARATEHNNYIGSFHKHHPGNLINICEHCHDEIHKSNREHRIVKTSNGYEIMPI